MSVDFICAWGGERKFEPEPAEIDACARELCAVAIGDDGRTWLEADEGTRNSWRAVASHVMIGRFFACRLAEKVQQYLGADEEEGAYHDPDLAPLRKAWEEFIAIAPHDRCDCPCTHFPGTTGVCGGCNCADGEP